MKTTRPFLKWAGGKYQIINKIYSVLPKAKRLIEPFAGAGSVFLNADYPSYLIAEQNPDLINIFTQLKNHRNEFIEYCKTFFVKSFNTKEHYYHLRNQFNASTNPKERAALFLYLNRHGYNGLCRYNNSSQFNVPFGQYTNPYFPHKEMQAFYKKSQKAEFLLADFRETFKKVNKDDVVYCDPPYFPLSKTAKFTGYTANSFSESDQLELANIAQSYAAKGITVVISNHDIPVVREMYKGAEFVSFNVSRCISCDPKKRKSVKEIIAVFNSTV